MRYGDWFLKVPGIAGWLRLLAAWALLAPLLAFAQAERASLFTTEARAPEQGGAGGIAAKSAIDEPAAAGLSRIAKVDRDGLNGLRKAVASGRPGKLRLNLLHDVEYDAAIERSVRTASGYTLSGSIDGVPGGRAVLVVNGARVTGRVYTPQGAWAVHTTGALQTVERMAPEPLKCAVHSSVAGGTISVGGRRPAALFQRVRTAEPGAGLAGDGPPVPATAKSAAGNDGNVVDVLVVYPSFAREIEGGYGPMLSLIDLDIATANEAYAASGVDLRVELAAAVEVEYDRFLDHTARWHPAEGRFPAWDEALEHLSGTGDGHMDEVHALRDRHAADLVLMHLGSLGEERLTALYEYGGVALGVHDVSKENVENLGFSVARTGDGTFVAHELGHSMGLFHDRYEDWSNEPFPYSHGFRYENVETRGPITRGVIFGTIMSQYSGRQSDDYWPGFVLAFSNPELSHPLDPDLKLGVPGDEPSSEVDGPADAARHLNELRGVIANVRAGADADPCRYQLSGDGGELPPEGGTFRLRVETEADCAWAASAGEWVESISPAAGTGDGEVEVVVGGNANWGRPVEVLVAGQLHVRRQAGSRPVTPVCERSATRHDLVRWHPDYEDNSTAVGNVVFVNETPCEDLDFNPAYLASIRTFDRHTESRHDGIDWSRVRPGDFDGLTGLVSLKLHNVERLPPESFSGMTGLRVLQIDLPVPYLRDVPMLTDIAPGAFRGLPGLLRLEIDGHRIGTLQAGTFEGLSGLIHLGIRGSRAVFSAERPLPEPNYRPTTRLEPGVFSGLRNLRGLSVFGHDLGTLEAGALSGMSRLYGLILNNNRLTSVAPGAFDDLSELRWIQLANNPLSTLPGGLFGSLGRLLTINLSGNRLTRLPADVFKGLPDLGGLTLANNSLTSLEPDVFSGLRNLKRLDMMYNRLRNLPTGLFADLESLQSLDLQGNRLGALRADAFDGLDRLRWLDLSNAGVTSLAPGVFHSLPGIWTVDLEKNGLRSIAPGTFRGLTLAGLHLGANPGSPFPFTTTPVVDPAWEPVAGLPTEVAVNSLPAAPFFIDVTLDANGGSQSGREINISSGETVGNSSISVTPDGDGPVTVRVEGTQRDEAVRLHESQIDVGEGLYVPILYRFGHSHVRAEPGPPLVLYGIEDRALTFGQGSETIDLVGVFSYFLGMAEYAAESSDGAVAAVAVEDGALTVTPGQAGTAEVTVTATAPDGETMTRRFTVAVRVPSVPLFLSDANPEREGFARLVNLSERAGDVRITAVDDAGARRGPVRLRLRANGAAHFNSGDLEGGNSAKGLAEGIGLGEGDWRLEFETDLEIEALSYVRTTDGFVTSVHEAAPVEGGVSRIATFNPASNDRQASRLRVVNPGREPAQVTVRGVDDAGASPGGPVRFTVPAGASREFDALQLEVGDAELEGALGDGEGKWRLTVEADGPVAAMSLLESTATGHLTNLSSGPRPPDADGARHVPLMPAASDANGREGFVRVINRSGRAGTVRIAAFDDAGTAHGPLELSVEAGAAAHFNSSDLEFGNAAKGLSGSAGPPGEGDWRLELTSGLDIEVLAYVRTEDGFLTAMHGAVAVEDGRRRAAFFNPGSNTRQVSRLRLVNPTTEEVVVAVVGTDDAGRTPPNRGATYVRVPAGGAVTLDASELEAGVPDTNTWYNAWRESHGFPLDEWKLDYWGRWPLGDGVGKWRLTVVPDGDVPVQVMSLLESPTGHLTNLSSGGR